MRRHVAWTLALVAVLTGAVPALADGGGGNGDAAASVGAGGVTVKVGSPGSPPQPGAGEAGSSAPPPSCPPVYIAGAELPYLAGNTTQGTWVVYPCLLKLGAPSAVTWVPATQGTPTPIAAIAAQAALSGAAWPAVALSFNPPPGRLLVNFPTWLHLSSGWQEITATASLAGISATVTAKPQWVRWDMGDGGAVTCRSAGTAYDAHLSWQANLDRRDCGYTYTESSAGQAAGRFHVTVVIHYEVTWASTSGAAGSLGGYDRSASTWVAVGQVQSLED